MRQCSDKEFSRRTRPCILFDMKRCIAPCVGRCEKKEYDLLVERTKKFLQGQDKEIVKDLYEEMQHYSDQLEFEKASAVLSTIRHIEKTTEKQKVARPLGGDSDILGVFREGDEVILVLMFFRGGTLTGSRHYNFSNILETDNELLISFILQHYMQSEEELPHEILIPEEIEDAAVLAELIASESPRKVSILTPKKGDKFELVKMAKINAETTFRKDKDEKTIKERTLLSMQEKFGLIRFPRRIECFDISNISGTGTVGTMIAFTDGDKDTKRYRKYKIRTADNSDDYGAMYEILTRRLTRGKEENDLPDLLIVDGGKGHLNVAQRVMRELNLITVELIALAKEQGRHDKGMTAEQVFLADIKDPIILKQNSPILFLLQKIRDEAHRTAISFQRNRRSRSLVTSSLEQIHGVGPAKKKILLRHFGSLKALKEASKEEIAAVPGINQKNAEAIYQALHQQNL